MTNEPPHIQNPSCEECDILRDVIQKGREYWEGYADAECELTGEPAKRGPIIRRAISTHDELLAAAKNFVWGSNHIVLAHRQRLLDAIAKAEAIQ